MELLCPGLSSFKINHQTIPKMGVSETVTDMRTRPFQDQVEEDSPLAMSLFLPGVNEGSN